MERYTIEVRGPMQGKRLDLAIVAAKLGLSRRKVRRIIDLGGSYVNRKRVRVASREVQFFDVIELEYDPEAFRRVQKEIGFSHDDILYQNHGIIAINKPAGLPSQASKTQAQFHVIPLLQNFLKGRGDAKTQLHLTHRLDKETTGVMLLAVHKSQMKWLSDQFRERTISKEYHALAYGLSKEASFSVNCRLSAINPATGVVKVAHRSGAGKESLTHFEVIRLFPESNMTLFRCRPVTGRTHQIRVQLEDKGFPIVGDKVYGGTKRPKLSDELEQIVAEHHMLHCRMMEFQPCSDGQRVQVRAEYPKNFKELLALLETR